MKRYQYSTIALCVLLATGCVARSELPEQQLDVPAQWQNGQSQPQEQAISHWWTSFGDPQLDGWIDQVLASNSDLALATLTLRQARLEAGLATSDTYPDVSGTVSADRSKPLDGGDSSKSYQA
ncbi:TolC family protein, partial [Vibrio diabolicus]|nr:TolC family protein [Vibrio diabolicus]